jgi:hypothetical protein
VDEVAYIISLLYVELIDDDGVCLGPDGCVVEVPGEAKSSLTAERSISSSSLAGV